LDDFEVGKVATQALREPRGCLPEMEAVMEDDEKFHGKAAASD